MKGIKKVFKKVVKVLKKVVPIILAAAAIYFTAGAVLALPGASIGLGGAVSSITAGLGNGVVAGVVRGALVSAAHGAAIGGLTSAATGGSFSQGARAGAVTGFVVGGVSGGVNAARAAIPPGGTPPILPSATPPAELGVDAINNMIPTGSVATGSSAGGLFRSGGWLQRNQDLVGNVISGVGSGLLAGSEEDYLRERFRLTAANYAGTDPGRNYRDVAPVTSGQPTNRFDPSAYGSFEYQYDPAQGRIIKVPVSQQGA